jgi:hypothetical protein
MKQLAFNQCLSVIGWRYPEVRRRSGFTEYAVWNWNAGFNEPPPEIMEWMMKAVEWHIKNPFPTKEKINGRKT